MPTVWETFPIKFEGGLITNQGRLEHGVNAPGSATVLQNFEADVQGGYTKLAGYVKFSEDTVPNTGVVKGVVALGSSRVLAARGGNFSYSEGAAWTSKLVIPLTTYETIHYDSYDYGSGEFFVVVDGVNYPAFYNTTANTMAYGVGFPVDVLGASFVRNYKNHLFYAVGKNLVFSSPFLDSDFTPANGSGIINLGYEITGMISFREQLFVFCLDRIFRLSGNALADFQVQPVTTNTGCVSGHTIQEVGGDIMYLSNDGVRYLSASERNNDFGLTRASEKVQKEVIDWVNLNAHYCSMTIAPKNQYRMFLYETTATRETSKGLLGVKFSNQTVEDVSWSSILGMRVYATSTYFSGDADEHYFCNDSGYVYRMESSTSFDGEVIDAVFETPYMPITDPKIRKTLFKHSLYTRGDTAMNLTLQVLFDYDAEGILRPEPVMVSTNANSAVYGAATTLYGSTPYATTSEIQLYNNLVGSGFVVALRYTNSHIEPPFNLNFALLEYKNNERR